MKNILVFAHESEMNGASYSLLTILEELKSEYNFFIIIPKLGLFSQELDRINVQYSAIPIERIGTFYNYNAKEYIYRLIYYKKNIKKDIYNISKALQTFSPDIIYTNTSVLSIGYYYAKRINKPHVWHIREYGDLHLNISYFPSRWYLKRLILKSKLSIFTTTLLRNHWLNKNINSKIVYNGVNLSAVNTGNFSKNNSQIQLGIVGVISKSKGQLEAVQILQKLIEKGEKKYNLSIFGGELDGNYVKEMKEFISHNYLQDVCNFYGYKPNSELYSNMDILLSCSQYEAFGRTIIEAMANDVLVIAKNSGGPKEIISHGTDGFLYDDILQAFSIIKEIEANKIDVEKIKENARQKVLNSFSIKIYIEEMRNVFKEVK